MSHWGVDWHHDIATMTKNRWLLQEQNPNEACASKYHSSSYSLCVDLMHDGEFIGILQLVSETKIIDEQDQSLSRNLSNAKNR